MKLAEALNLRADVQKRIEQLKQRLFTSAKVQEGEQPPEDPAQLLNELERLSSELEALVRKINKTNSLTLFQEEVMLSDALAKRDILLMRRNVYSSLAEVASARQDRYSKSEIKYISTINVSEMRRIVDELSQQYRLLDSSIQAANWNIDLLD